MRIAILWPHLSGYFQTCLKALADAGVELLVSSFQSSQQAPYTQREFSWLDSHTRLVWPTEKIDRKRLLVEIEGFQPDVILVMDIHGPRTTTDADLLANKAIAATPAGQKKNIVRMGGQYLLGFGPRTAEAVHDLAKAFYGSETSQ